MFMAVNNIHLVHEYNRLLFNSFLNKVPTYFLP